MAKPQRENGHIDIANTIADSLAKINLAPYESRVMWAVIRKTWGYVQRGAKGKIVYDKSGLPLKKKLDWVSVTQLQELTGMDRRNVSKIKARLIGRRIIIKNGNKLGFNKNYDQWLSLKQTTGAIVYRDTRPKPFPPYGYRYKHRDGVFCEYCLKEFRMDKNELTEHHIIPVSQGGKDIKQNIAWLCNGCDKKVHQELRELGIVDSDDTRPLGRYYRQFMQKLSLKQTTFLSSILTHTKEDKIKKIQKKRKPSCRDLKIPDELLKVCDNLRTKMETLILRNKPDYKFRGGVNRPEKWTREFGLMVQRDARSPERIDRVMEWALDHPFWRTNILSPDKLRMQFDALELRMGSRKSGVAQKDWLLLATARSRLEKSCSSKAILSELEKFDVRLHNELRKFLDKTYPQGHSYQKAKDEYEKQHDKGS